MFVQNVPFYPGFDLKSGSSNTTGQLHNKNLSFYSLNQAGRNTVLFASPKGRQRHKWLLKDDCPLLPNRVCRQCCLTWPLCYGYRDNKNTALLSTWLLLRDEPAQMETWLWFPARGSENPVYFTVCINFPAENLQSLHKGLWFQQWWLSCLPRLRYSAHFLMLFVWVLRNCSCCRYGGTGRMSQPLCRMCMNIHKGLPGPALFWHTESFCSRRSPNPWLFRASWHLHIEVSEPLKNGCKRLSSNWLLCLAWT